MAQIRIVLAVALLSATALAQERSPARPEAVVDTPEFMTWLMKPAYLDLQQAAHQPPIDRAEWAALYQKAVRLAETANLLFIRHHAGADTPEWAERSAAARTAAAGVASAALHGLRSARPADFAAVKQGWNEVSAACNACHQRFGGTNGPTIRP
jgi:cytochrome c556